VGELLPTWDIAQAPTTSPALHKAGYSVSTSEEQEPQIASGAQDGQPRSTDEPAATTELPSIPEPGPTANEPSEADEATLGQPVPPAAQHCPYCQAPRTGTEVYCADCGWIFPAAEPGEAVPAQSAEIRVKSRYRLGQRLGTRGEVSRYRGTDTGLTGTEAAPVVILQAPVPVGVDAVAATDVPAEVSTAPPEARVPLSEANTLLLMSEVVATGSPWPGLGWELAILDQLHSPALPQPLDHFVEDGFEYLVEEVPSGQLLWDAWDDPETTAEQRFRWLEQIAQALHQLHQHGAILEGFRPEIVAISAERQAKLTDLADLLPLPLPPDPPIRASYYTAPELVLASSSADARSDLYSFGALLYALHVGRELTDLDFEMQGVPKSFIQRFPDAHPLFARLVSKTFCRDVNARFPTEDAAKEDPTGFTELIRTLDICSRALDHVRLEIAAWTTTGMVRTSNEDAFALLHAVEAREDRMSDSALLLLADGMGGYEAGEVAADLAIRTMRKFLLQQPAFASLAGESGLDGDDAEQPSGALIQFSVEIYEQLLATALREANKAVSDASKSNPGRRGMGCTAEAVYVDGRHVVVGHVGDSRTYHLHQGRIIQLTRDQTWVNRMVELGLLSTEEAEEHPRRSELHQAIGGHSEIEPALYHSPLKPGDWVVVCSDGLSNHVSAELLKEILQSSMSAESAARRLINMVNFAGATDNATAVVVRAT